MSCSPSAKKLRKLTDEFTELHEGLPPDSIDCERYRRPEGPIRQAGRVVQIDYDKLIPSGKQWYYHPISLKSEPKLGFDRQGIPVVYAGKIHVTTHGIEDLDARHQTTEHSPKEPRSLTVFGRLRQIRYKRQSGSRVETWKPSVALALAHDERGELHLIKERAHNEGTMAKRRNRRRNAVFTNNKTKNAVTLGAIAVGSAVVGTVVNQWMTKGKINPALPVSELNPARFSGYKLAAIEAAVGVVAAAGAYAWKKNETLALAAGVGPVAFGAKAGYDEFRAQSAANKSLPPGVGVNGKTLNGSAPPMPGGLPRGYYPVPRSACGVR